MENLPGPVVLRIRVKTAAEQKHHFHEQSYRPAICQPVIRCPKDRLANRQPNLIVAQNLAQFRRELLAVSDHLVFETLQAVLLEYLELCATDYQYAASDRPYTSGQDQTPAKILALLASLQVFDESFRMRPCLLYRHALLGGSCSRGLYARV
jgi:hypothetical protein